MCGTDGARGSCKGVIVGTQKSRAIAVFVALYVVVCAAGVVASLCAPSYRDGDHVSAAALRSAVRLVAFEGEGPAELSLYFDEPVDDLALVTTSQRPLDIAAGSRPLAFLAVDGLMGTIRSAHVGFDCLVKTGDGAWRLTLTSPEGDARSLGAVSLCSSGTVGLAVVAYNYCLPLVQGIYLAISAYGFLLYRSKRERPLLMFSLYALFLFLWGLGSFLSRVTGAFEVAPPVVDAASSMLFGVAVAYGIATCICFCTLERNTSRGWYVPLVVGALLGVAVDALPPLIDSVLVIVVYMAGGVVLLATFDGTRRLPRAVLYGLSISQGLRTVFLICSLSSLTLPVQFEIVRQMHLLAMPYVIGCLVDIGGAFSRRFKRAEVQAVELALINKELDERVEARTRELTRQQELRASVLANLFHDCKTPLSIIRGAIARMDDDPASRSSQAEIVERQVTNLTAIVDELFAVVKLQDDTLLMDTEPVELAPLLEGISASCAVEAAARDIEVVCSCASNPVAWGDEIWLGRAFQNLVANAVNFSKPKGVVEIGLADDGKIATVTVRDHGAGIDPADIDKVFDRYYRTAKDRTSRQSSGLGLSIAQGVVEKHGGTIAVASELGRGTTFTVVLPMWVEEGAPA